MFFFLLAFEISESCSVMFNILRLTLCLAYASLFKVPDYRYGIHNVAATVA